MGKMFSRSRSRRARACCDLGLQGGLQTTVTLAGELGHVLLDKLNFTPESKKLLGCSSFGVFFQVKAC